MRLAREDDPSKAFPLSDTGEVLRIEYNGAAMTWRMPDGKALRIMAALGEAIRTAHIRNCEALSLSGKLNHYLNMVSGKYNRCLVIHLGAKSCQMTWTLLSHTRPR